MPRRRFPLALSLLSCTLALGGCVPAARPERTPAPAAVAVTTRPPAGGHQAGEVVRRLYRAPAAWEPEGFRVYKEEGRLWVFRDGSASLEEYREEGPPEKRVTKIGAGPDGQTVMSEEGATIDAWLAALGMPLPSAMPAVAEPPVPTEPAHVARLERPGFAVFEEDGRLWVFREGSPGLEAYQQEGPPEKRVTRVGAGPDRQTVMSTEGETIDAWLARIPSAGHAKPGFVVFEEDGRLWVFREGSPGLEAYQQEGPPEKRVTRIGVGPHGETMMAVDAETLDAYRGR